MPLKNQIAVPARPLRSQGQIYNETLALDDESWINDVGPWTVMEGASEVPGYGPFELLLKDAGISEIMSIGPHRIYVERNGCIEEASCSFEDECHMMRIIGNMLRQAGQYKKQTGPIFDIRLPDGTLINVVLPPVAVHGPTITLRKRPPEPLTLEDLVTCGSMSQDMSDFLSMWVQARLNIVLCGQHGSG
ncbi:MAG: Flp pilus assembly complex ATPase component TadA, partial [Chloroflexota bacterium]|nr:Flp pilus assembly complex ATPase component TadA [Chloroflexota bacterium]